MVEIKIKEIIRTQKFERKIKSIKDKSIGTRVMKQIKKITTQGARNLPAKISKKIQKIKNLPIIF